MMLKWMSIPVLFLVISSTFVIALENENEIKLSNNEAIVSNTTLSSSVNATSADVTSTTALPTIATTKSTCKFAYHELLFTA